jgi:lipopolysaccharide/colanic/teichoic acid biosynthesis glycosyltransferase
MRIAVTNAWGAIGRTLVSRLAAGGAEVMLLDRDADDPDGHQDALTTHPPDQRADTAEGFDLLVHLEGGPSRSNPIPSPTTAAPGRVVRVVPWRADAEAPSAAPGGGTGPEAPLVLRVPGVCERPSAGPIGRVIHWIRSALHPALSVDRLARFLLEEARHTDRTTVALSDGQGGNPVYAVVMRGIDLTFALAVILGFWWGLAAIWLAVRLDSPGPGLFRQTRIGRRGRAFTCWKFRTMAPGTRQAGTHELSADAVTRIGRFLRASKLDELPQVLNILQGEIALIGPRPCLPVQTELIEARARRGVLDLMPGISGLAQVEGIDMSDPARLADRDSDYAAHQSIGFDLRLMVATATGRGRGDRVASWAPGETEQ